MLATLISNSSPQVIHPPQPPRCDFAPSSSSAMIVRPPQPCGTISESRSRTPFSIIQGFGAAGGARNAELSEKAASKFQPHFPAVSQDGVTVFHSPLTTGPPGRHVACSEAGPETPSGPHSAPQGRLQKDPTPGSRANTINPANCHVPGSQNPWSLYSGLTVSSQELNLASGQILPRNVCKPRLPGSHITGAASQKTTCFCRSTPHHCLPGHLATQDALASHPAHRPGRQGVVRGRRRTSKGRPCIPGWRSCTSSLRVRKLSLCKLSEPPPAPASRLSWFLGPQSLLCPDLPGPDGNPDKLVGAKVLTAGPCLMYFATQIK
ncbi:uncharacterized protein [Gorilla gorilla gorilla]|uniref:uncharacterized protein isoform X1 n=1 Tax=Gorilla gorilla gorilla TaxID=9595 RepID=UPI002445793D|nr:uncharacterized protein LOC129527725 isoform X1 [Gorilla gorilla gorilla]XP_055222526.1 uncharacterized protein LOC129527725 isoform X1 [Gorilla gorilla gorilla]XP_055222527.1 uncharacterized protein LOC129527725 isoform X1 [Gorilla gorilla gorilla]XP_055222528.1 uncharacterized protein LOC129527725 isoform X1 [Gorilla gorilla gorilla]